MRLIGFCRVCKKVKSVFVHVPGPPNMAQVGVCSDCDDAQRQGRAR